MDTTAITGNIVNSIIEPKADAAPVPASDAPIEDQFKDDDFSRRLAILAKKEKAILDGQKMTQAEKQRIEEERARLSKWSEFEELDDEKAIDFIKKKGLSFEKIQQKWLEQLGDEDIDPIQKQIKELNQKLAHKDTEYKKLLEETLSERDRKANDERIAEQSKYYNAELKQYLQQNGEKYDLINTFGAADEVFNVIKDVYLKTSEKGEPRLLTFDEASDLYEKQLEEQVKGMLKSNKVRNLFGLSDTKEPDFMAQLMGQKTIDDSFSHTSAKSAEGMTQAERERAAAKLFESMRTGA